MNSVSSIDFCNDTIQFYFASAYISYSLNAQPICTMRKFFFWLIEFDDDVCRSDMFHVF